jgi:hypothetical protein
MRIPKVRNARTRTEQDQIPNKYPVECRNSLGCVDLEKEGCLESRRRLQRSGKYDWGVAGSRQSSGEGCRMSASVRRWSWWFWADRQWLNRPGMVRSRLDLFEKHCMGFEIHCMEFVRGF